MLFYLSINGYLFIRHGLKRHSELKYVANLKRNPIITEGKSLYQINTQIAKQIFRFVHLASPANIFPDNVPILELVCHLVH